MSPSEHTIHVALPSRTLEDMPGSIWLLSAAYDFLGAWEAPAHVLCLGVSYHSANDNWISVTSSANIWFTLAFGGMPVMISTV